MPYSALTLDELTAFARDEIRNRIPGADLSTGSYYDLRARLLAAIFIGGQAQGKFLARQVLPDTAEAEYLERHATIRGVDRQDAAAATGSAMLLSTGGAGPYVQPINSVLDHADGTQYELTAAATVFTPTWSGKTVVTGSTLGRVIVAPNLSGMAVGDVVDVAGQKIVIGALVPLVSAFDTLTPLTAALTPGAAIDPAAGALASIRALVAGAVSNKPARDVLTLAAPTANISPSVVVLLLSGGGDQESDEELRSRVIDHVAIPPGAGNVEDFRTWARTTPGVRAGDAFVLPNVRGLGTVDVYPVGISGARAPSATMIAAIAAQVATKAPAFVDVLVKAFSYSAQIPITVSFVAGPEWASDWGVTSYTVAGGSTTTRINTSASFVGLAEVGDRVVLQCLIGGIYYAFQRVIEGITATYFDLDEALPAVPATGKTIRSGGPLWQSAYDALVALFDNLGPGSVAGGVGYLRHPSDVDAGPSTLYRADVVETIQSLHGVINTTVTDPVADTTASLGEILQRGMIDVICV